MNLCSDDHEEICYECKNCPLCELRNELNGEVDKLKLQVENLETDCSDLETKLADAKEGLLLLKGEEEPC